MNLYERGDVKYPSDSNGEIKRSEWQKPIQFTLSLIGYAVGLSSIFRFPYLALNYGGGAFLIAYSIFVIFCGIPLYWMEFTLGQFTGQSPVEAFGFAPLFRGIGWSMMLVSGKISMYYNILMAWTLYYFFQSFQWKLPWNSCNNTWNTPACFCHSDKCAAVLPSQNRTSSTTEFWLHRVLELSPNINELGGINWSLCGCMLASWILTYLCLFKGIKNSGRAVCVIALLPYVFFIILVVRGATLPGAYIGLKYYFYPELEKLKSTKVWTQAGIQLFYSLGPAWGGLITLSSYNRYECKYSRDALLLPVLCGVTGILGGLAVFSVVGHLAHSMGKLDISDFTNSGPGLVFIAYPAALVYIPGASIIAVCFFALLFTLGLGSQVVSF
ncbi:unnamed protein product [Rodentolepis nana]|uniref:Transporter n=1 Tax=Rodentolepis nana TaxID=102285 RepID=A0A0R3TPD5_RODNA|nr:unnamed protein product [Rodentolepis nana]